MTTKQHTDPTNEDTAPDAVETAQDAHDTQAPQEDDGNPNREAARYRTRLRETESERDDLAERVTALQRAEVERVAGATVTNPAALWAAEVQLADLLDDAGAVDPDKVRAAAGQAAERLGLARPRRNVVPNEGGNPRRRHADSMENVITGGR